MSKSVDDIWKALKASTAPGDSRARGRGSSAVLASSLPSASNVEGQRHKRGCDYSICGRSSDLENDQEPTFTQRDVNCLSDEDRNLRKKAIKKLHTQIKRTFPENCSEDMIDILNSESLRGKVLHMLGDQTDMCRESAMEVISILVSSAPEESMIQLQALEALKIRIGVGQPYALETSEEIRLKIAQLTATVMISKASSDESVLNDVAAILSRCLDDSFHETKKCACQGVTALARGSQHGTLAGVCEVLVHSLVDLLRHPHSRVRISGMQALTSVGQNTSLPCELLATKVVPAFRMTAVDKSCDLRLGTFCACASWLEQYIGQMGQSFAIPHLLPILLLGITDSSPEARAQTLAMLSQTAQLYWQHSDPSDRCNLMELVEHTRNNAASATASLPEPLDEHAPAALRAMMNAQLSVILPAVLDDVQEWTAALRSTASRSLYSIMALSEHGLTSHLERILPCLCHAVGDDDEAVTSRIIHCVHVVGAFCEVHHWMPLMLEYFASLKGQPNATVCALVTMSGLSLAAARASRPVQREHLGQVAEWLAGEEMRSLQHPEIQRQLAMVVSNVIDLAGSAVSFVAKPLFHSLMHLQGHVLDEYTTKEVLKAQEKLATGCGVASASELASHHASSLIAGMLERSEQWTSIHPDIPSFLSVLRISPGDSLSAMGKPLCVALNCIVRDHERDPALRMTLLRSIDGLLQSDEQGCAFCLHHGQPLLVTVLLPPLVWRAGKSAAAVRYSALHAVHTLFSLRRVGPLDLKPSLLTQGNLLPLLLQCMDEDWYVDTRKLACCTMVALLSLAGSQLTDDARRQVYPELTKRMDDSSTETRIAAAAAVQAFVRYAMPSTYSNTNSGYFVGAFLIHLDDSDKEVQRSVLAALQEVKVKNPDVLKAEISKVYQNFRCKSLLDMLLS